MADPFLICVGNRIDHYCDPAAESALVEAQPEDPARGELDRERFHAALGMLPEVEQLVVRARMAGATERQIAERIATTQQAVSYRLHRALKRLRAIAEHDLVGLDRVELERALADIPELSELDRRILLSLVETRSHPITAQRLGLTARFTMRRVVRALAYLATTGYGKLYRALTENTNPLRNVAPRWNGCAQEAPTCEPVAYGGPPELRPLSAAEVSAIKELIAAGRPQSLVAEEHQLDPSYMDFAVFGTWGHT